MLDYSDRESGSGNLAAKTLLDIEAVLFNPDRPFKFAFGRLSPIYIDVRRLIGINSSVRKDIMTDCAMMLIPYTSQFDMAAGGETAGIPFASWIADSLSLRMVYVRKTPKSHGRMAQIEGMSEAELAEEHRVLLVEDLMSEGGSKENFIDAIDSTGNRVTTSFVVFSYGCFGAEDKLRKKGITPLSLIDARLLVAVARDLGLYRYNLGLLSAVEVFIDDPDAYWQQHDPAGFEKWKHNDDGPSR